MKRKHLTFRDIQINEGARQTYLSMDKLLIAKKSPLPSGSDTDPYDTYKTGMMEKYPSDISKMMKETRADLRGMNNYLTGKGVFPKKLENKYGVEIVKDFYNKTKEWYAELLKKNPLKRDFSKAKGLEQAVVTSLKQSGPDEKKFVIPTPKNLWTSLNLIAKGKKTIKELQSEIVSTIEQSVKNATLTKWDVRVPISGKNKFVNIEVKKANPKDKSINLAEVWGGKTKPQIDKLVNGLESEKELEILKNAYNGKYLPFLNSKLKRVVNRIKKPYLAIGLDYKEGKDVFVYAPGSYNVRFVVSNSTHKYTQRASYRGFSRIILMATIKEGASSMTLGEFSSHVEGKNQVAQKSIDMKLNNFHNEIVGD